MTQTKTVFGIDLGTTNSVIAWTVDGQAKVIEYEGEALLPSVIGRGPEDELLVGTPALNQSALHPDRTIRSIKRMMGTPQKVQLAQEWLQPPEVSALILRELARRAAVVTGEPVERAVITVPAFFHDAQRQATRTAGELAGLEVVRIINEPTAAALSFDAGGSAEKLLLVYDLGGGTFDVSVVLSSPDLVEVLASHGDVELGGDDFDVLLSQRIAERFVEAGNPDPRGDAVAVARLLRAAEAVKCKLSEEVYVTAREEYLLKDAKGVARHLDLEVGREEFEHLLADSIERSLDSVHEALNAAGKRPADVDEVLLVGGSTRIPLVRRRLGELFSRPVRQDIHPDRCVALGAAIRGAREVGVDQARVLVDVTPYSFGPSYADFIDGEYSPDCYRPLIERGSPLPVTRSESFYTMFDGQDAWDVKLFQGESPRAQDNALVGRFRASGFSAEAPEGNEIVCRVQLDLDGILHVDVIEKKTGLRKTVKIERAIAAMTEAELAAARRRTTQLWDERERGTDDDDAERADPAPCENPPSEDGNEVDHDEVAVGLLRRAARFRQRLAAEDQGELDALTQSLRAALGADDGEVGRLIAEIEDLLYYADEL